MITIIKKDLVGKVNDNNYFVGELRGLSTDTKPADIENQKIGNGSVFIEIDTGKLFFFDFEGQEWKEVE